MRVLVAILFVVALSTLFACAAPERPADPRTACLRAEDCVVCGDACVSADYAASASCPIARLEECACASRRCIPG